VNWKLLEIGFQTGIETFSPFPDREKRIAAIWLLSERSFDQYFFVVRPGGRQNANLNYSMAFDIFPKPLGQLGRDHRNVDVLGVGVKTLIR